MAAVLLAAVLGLTLDRQNKDVSVLLTLAACSMVGVMALSYLRPVLDFLGELESAAGHQENFLGVLLRAAGVGIAAELAGMICTDAGKGSLGKALQMLGSAVILQQSVPVLRALLTMIRQILGT